MHPYARLKKVLFDLGAELTSEIDSPDCFGSYVAVYANQGRPLRLIWDGKDAHGLVQQHRAGDDWHDATGVVTEADLDDSRQCHAKIEEFRQTVATLLR